MDEGIPETLDKIKKAKINTVNVAVHYHSGRFLLSHNPKRKVYFPKPGAIYFKEDPSCYADSKIKPISSSKYTDEFWNQLREETNKRSMKITAWMLALHN